jgi:hypothetical protein
MIGAPLFRSAILEGDGTTGALPPRRLRTTLVVSAALHVVAGGGLLILALMEVGDVPAPPMVVRFFAVPPPAPRLVPLREPHETQRPPKPPPPRPLAIPPLAFAAPDPAPAPQLAPEPLRIEPEALPIRIADAAPDVQVQDLPPGAPTASRLEPIGAHARPQTGTGEEPELAYLVPGERDTERGRGGGLAGRDAAAIPPGGDPTGSIRRGEDRRPAQAERLGSEGAFAGTGLATLLGRKYGVTLMDASRLGSRTSDGARYALLLPALSEAYRSIAFRGRRHGGAADAVESVQVDSNAIAIRYRDGTVHVLAPTADGLVALFVSSPDPGATSKVQEAERALLALQRFAREAAEGRAG